MKSIYCLLLVVISTAYMVEIHAERPAICRAGSVNYCKDMQSAKACGVRKTLNYIVNACNPQVESLLISRTASGFPNKKFHPVVRKLRFCQLVWSPPAGYEIRKNGDHYDVLNPNIGFLHVG
ncbi:hypothetical protein TSAR_014060 [Trichomalopsis sarcophagae]|uniref:Uncharacterized protein n=1 Tax=Trichomalopsis sarcophagae TaxID=543379 RepID=A0A232FM66_9HYME|nr:hypothetical protein TSAR_014060 [Trichomalopsis sarcophagae]